MPHVGLPGRVGQHLGDVERVGAGGGVVGDLPRALALPQRLPLGLDGLRVVAALRAHARVRLAAEKAWTFGRGGVMSVTGDARPRESDIAHSLLCTATVLAALLPPRHGVRRFLRLPAERLLAAQRGQGPGRTRLVRATATTASSARRRASTPTTRRGSRARSSGAPALHFDGGDFVTIPDSSDLEPQQVTVSAWFRGSGIARQLQVPGRQGLEPVRDRLLRALHGRERRPAFYVSDGTRPTASRSPPTPARACGTASGTTPSGTFDGSTVRLFIDGKEIGTGTPRGGAPIGYGTPARQHDARRLRRHLRPQPDRRPRRGVDLEEGAARRRHLEEGAASSSLRTEPR